MVNKLVSMLRRTVTMLNLGLLMVALAKLLPDTLGMLEMVGWILLAVSGGLFLLGRKRL